MIASEGDAQRAVAAHKASMVADLRVELERKNKLTPAEVEKEREETRLNEEFMRGTVRDPFHRHSAKFCMSRIKPVRDPLLT